MVKPFSTFLLVVTIMFALFGQAYSYAAMNCEMTDHHTNSHQMSSSMSHDTMSQSNMVMDNDCCQQECNCPTNGCSSVTCVSSRLSSQLAHHLSEKISLADHRLIQSEITSLYRPPILA